jgi:hypothetical protein
MKSAPTLLPLLSHQKVHRVLSKVGALNKDEKSFARRETRQSSRVSQRWLALISVSCERTQLLFVRRRCKRRKQSDTGNGT